MMKMQNNTLAEAVSYIRKELCSIYDESEINLTSQILFKHYFGISKKELILNGDKRFSESDLLKIIYAVKDLKKRKPLAYILGEWEFYGYPFKVNEHTLIPRQETEELVQLIIQENTKKTPLILDIGTGSGCISITLKKNIPNSTVYAVDISSEAIKIAKQNAILNSVEVKFIEADILQSLSMEESLDIIVSNPPYIPKGEKNSMESNVIDFEPHVALFVENENPFLFYETIAGFALSKLKSDGKLYVEIHEKYGNEIKELFEDVGFLNVRIIKDIHNKDRIICGEKNQIENDNLLQSINYVITLFSTSKKNFKYHNSLHTFRVVSVAFKIGKFYNLSDEDMEILMISAWFHDIGYLKTIENHELYSSLEAESFLSQIKYPSLKIELVKECILSTKIGTTPAHLLSKILVDSDLSALGSTKHFIYSEKLRQELSENGLTQINKEEWVEIEIDFLKKHVYHTEYAQSHFEPTKQKHLQYRIDELSKIKNKI
ncbi:MAG: peptide chain release factor N(5)-glutamine methyltransferase [Flavobacteriales bacterium]|nr:peptide chain release factor N(5)-glutamine methyltransferase [Flavobacteriales bacterium]